GRGRPGAGLDPRALRDRPVARRVTRAPQWGPAGPRRARRPWPRPSGAAPAPRPAVEPLAAAATLEPAALCEQAQAETGRSDFGDDAFRERLEVLTAALRNEAGLSPFGRVSTQGQLVALLRNRLLVEDRIAHHPEILDVEIRRPVVIAGQPRT